MAFHYKIGATHRRIGPDAWQRGPSSILTDTRASRSERFALNTRALLPKSLVYRPEHDVAMTLTHPS